MLTKKLEPLPALLKNINSKYLEVTGLFKKKRRRGIQGNSDGDRTETTTTNNIGSFIFQTSPFLIQLELIQLSVQLLEQQTFLLRID